MEALLAAIIRYAVKFVFMVVALFIGINIGKFLRIRKNTKKNNNVE